MPAASVAAPTRAAPSCSQAYGLAGALVREAESKGVALEDLPLETLQKASAAFEEDIRAVTGRSMDHPR